MGQHQSALGGNPGENNQPDGSAATKTNQDLLWDIFNNNALLEQQISSNRYTASSSAAAEAEDPSSQFRLRQDYFDEDTEKSYRANEKYYHGSTKWWSALLSRPLFEAQEAPAQTQAQGERQLARELAQTIAVMREETGTAQVLKDSSFDKRTGFLMHFYKELADKAADCSESTKAFISMTVAEERAAAAEGSKTQGTIPPGVRLSIRTTMQIVLAMLNDSTRNNPSLCAHILDILINALTEAPALCLHKDDIPSTSPYVQVISDGVAEVSKFLAVTVGTFKGNTPEETHLIKTKAIEALLALNIASGSFESSVMLVKLLLSLHEEENQQQESTSSHFYSLRCPQSLVYLLQTLEEPILAALPKGIQHAVSSVTQQTEQQQVRPWQLLSFFLCQLFSVCVLEEEERQAKDSAVALSLPFIMNINKESFQTLYTISSFCRNLSKQQKQQQEQTDQSSIYDFALLLIFKMLKVHFRYLSLARIQPKDVGLAWPETPSGKEEEDEESKVLVDKISSLLRYYIFQAQGESETEKQIQLEACQTLAYALDYVVPNQSEQLNLLVNALQEVNAKQEEKKATASASASLPVGDTTSSSSSYSGAYFLEKMLAQLSDAAAVNRLFKPSETKNETEQAEKKKEKDEDNVQTILPLIFSYSKHQLERSLEQQLSSPSSKKEGEEARPGYVRFLLTLQNYIFASLAEQQPQQSKTEAGEEKEIESEAQKAKLEQRKQQQYYLRQYYTLQAMNHFQEQLESVRSVVLHHNAPSGKEATSGLGAQKTEQLLCFLTRSSTFALLPTLASSFLLDLSHSSASSSSSYPDLTRELMTKVLAFLRNVESLQSALTVGSASGSSASASSYGLTIVETLHSYANNMDICKHVAVSDASGLTLEFDENSRTEETHDWLKLFLAPNNCNQFQEQLTGGTHKWPKHPLHVPSNAVWFMFHSDASNVDWGFRCKVKYTIKNRFWLPELERTLLWIVVKIAMKMMGSYTDKELRYLPWLNSNLLKAGMSQQSINEEEGKGKAVSSTAEEETEFLRDLIELRGDAGRMHKKFIPSHLSSSASQLAGITSKSVDRAVRVVVAAILHHAHLTPDAIEFANEGSSSNPSPALKRAYRYGYKVKKWFIQQRQKEANQGSESDSRSVYDRLAEKVSQKAECLLRFTPVLSREQHLEKTGALKSQQQQRSVSLRRSVDRLIVQAGGHVPSTLGSTDDDSNDDVSSVLGGGSLLALAEGPGAPSWYWEPAAHAILSFVQSEEVNAEDVEECVRLRKQRANDRAECLALFADIVTSLKSCSSPALLQEVMALVGWALKSYAPLNDGGGKKEQRDKNLEKVLKARTKGLHHYTHDLQCAGAELQQKVSDAFYPLYKTLLSLLDSRATDPSTSVMQASAFVCDCLALKFHTENDFEFLLQSDIFQKILPLVLEVPSTSTDSSSLASSSSSSSDTDKGKEKQEPAQEQQQEGESSSSSEEQQKPKLKARRIIIASKDDMESEGQKEGWIDVEDEEDIRFLMGGTDDTESKAKQERFIALYKKRQAAWLLLQTIALQCIHPSSKANSNKSGTTTTNLYPAQLKLTQQLLDLLHEHLNNSWKENTTLFTGENGPRRVSFFGKGLGKRPKQTKLFRLSEDWSKDVDQTALSPADIGLLLFSLASASAVVRAELCTPKWMRLLMTFLKEENEEVPPLLVPEEAKEAEKAKEKEKEEEQETEEKKEEKKRKREIRRLLKTHNGTKSFMKVLVTHLFSITLPQVDPNNINNNANNECNQLAKQIADELLSGIGQGLGVASFLSIAVAKPAQEGEDEEAALERELQHVNRLPALSTAASNMLQALQRLLKSSEHWKNYITAWVMQRLQSALPKVLPALLLSGEPQQQEQLSALIQESVTALSLMGKRGVHFTPGTRVDPQEPVFHGKSSIFSVRDYTELYLHVGNDTTQTWTQPKDLKLMPEKTDVTAEFLNCAKQMLSLLPLFIASIPPQQEEDAKLLLAASSADEPENINYRTLYHPRCKDLLSSIAYAELQRLYFRTLSMFVQHADVRQALLQDQGLLQALLHIVLDQNKEDGALTLTAQETLLGELELECSARGAVYAKAKRDRAALATSLQRLNFPLQKCNSALEATGYDVLESYRTLLKEKLLQPKGKNPTKDSLPLSLENYIWSPATHSQLDDVSIRLMDDPSKTTTSALSMLFDPADASRPPIWFEILQMMHRLSSHYALDSLIRLILHFPALSPSSAPSPVSSSCSSKKGKEKEGGEEQSESLYTSLWSLLRQPSTLATFTKRVLGVRLNKESYQPIDVMQALTVLTRWSEKETLDKAMVLSAPPSKPTPSSSSMKEKEEEEKDKPSAEATLARLVAEMTSFLSTTPKHLASIKVHLEESEHPYPNEADYEKTIKLDGAERLIIIFDKETLTENNYDWLRFYQPDTRELIHQFSGPFTQFKNFAVSGNRLLMKFTSDATNNYWGYKFYVFGVTSQTSDEVTKALNLLELILRVSEGDNAAEVYSPAVYTAENLRLLTKAVSNSLDAATRTRIVRAIRHLIHPHLLKHYNTKPDLMELITTVQKSVVALYAQQKDDPVYSKSLQALIDLLLLAYNSLDVSEYDSLDWLLVGTHSQLSSIDWTNKQQIAELRRESDWEKRKWKPVRGLNGCISAAAFSSRTSIAKLHDNKPIALVTAAATKTNEKEKEKEGEEGAQATVEPDLSQTQDGWTVCGWFSLPLCETTGKNTLIQFDNGDQIVSTMEIEDGSELFGSTLTSKNISLAVWEASSETYHPIANLPVRKHEPAEESSFYEYESSWHFITIRAVAGGPVRGYTAQTLKTESSDPLSSTYNPSASIIAIGNGVDLGEQFGAIDQLHIVTDKALSSAELQKIHQKGLVNLYRKGSITPLEIAASNTYVGSIAISAKDGGIVGASKDVATVVAPVVVTKGKWYYEVKLVSNPKGLRIGWASADAAPSMPLGSESSTFGWDPQELIKYSEGNSDSYGRACTAGDVIGIKLDLDARVVEFYLNGTSLGIAFSAFSEMAMCPAFSLKQSNESQMTVHFNQSELKHLPVDVLPLGSSEVLLSAVHRPIPHKPKWLRRALDTRDLLVALLLRKPFPRSFMEQSLHDKEFLMFYAGNESNDVAYQTYLTLANNTNPNWTLAMDEQLIEMVNRICSAKDYDPMDISPDVLSMDESLSYQFPALANADFSLMIARFHLLRTLNKRITRLVPFLDCSRLHAASVPAEVFLHHLTPTVSNASGEGSSSSSSSSSASSSSSSRAKEQGTFPTDGTSLPGLAQRLRGLMLLLVKRKGLTELCSRNNTSKETQTFKFNRLKAAKFASDSRSGAIHTLFGQFYTQLAGLSDVNKLRQSDRAWRVEFIGEGATDQGGPYRESLAQMASELYGEALPLFVKTPNQRHHVGADRDKYTLNPTQTSEQALGMYRALGVIMGICIRTRNVFDLRLPSFVWKLYLGEEPTIKDLEGMDVITAQLLHVIETQLTDEEMFDLTFDDLTFVTTLSDGTEVELKKGGRNQRVTWENRLEFTRLVRECRLNECRKQAEAMRLGTSLMVSFPFLKLFTWSEIESLVCGKSDYDVDWLMARTAYRGTLSSSSPVVEKLWEVLREFAPEERAKFMRFVYGQARLPPSVGGSSAEFSIENFERGGCTADDLLPEAQTCSFKLKLPAYSTKERLKAKLLFAINNCAEIDSDFTPSQSWAPSDMQPASEEEHLSAEAEPMEVQAVQSHADDDYFEPVPMEYFEDVGRTREP